MSSQLHKIKDLIKSLPPKDAVLAEKFCNERDFESLKDLTWSALQMTESAYQTGSPKKYASVDIDELRDLAVLCADYYYMLYPEELLDNTDSGYDDSVEEDLV